MLGMRKDYTIIALLICVVTVVTIYYLSLMSKWETYEVGKRVKSLLSSSELEAEENELQQNSPTPVDYGDNKTILLWTSLFGDEYFGLGKTGQFNTCTGYKECVVTNDRNSLNVSEFKVIFFHGNELGRNDLPADRGPEQIYVFVNLESPKNKPPVDSWFENFFNMTMTYRLDSDIIWPYRIFRNIDTGEMVGPLKTPKWLEPSYDPMRFITELDFETKTKLAAWFVTDGKTSGGRELFVDDMKKHMAVDIVKRKDVVETTYFFYLAFENSLCQDYVTETFFDALRHNVIPVVYGGAEYKKFAPPHSYIDALDFDSPKSLAEFLIDLSNDREEYLKYFWWKRFYVVDSATSWTMCNLCEMLNDPSRIVKTYEKLTDWYSKDICPIQDGLDGKNYATKKLRAQKIPTLYKS